MHKTDKKAMNYLRGLGKFQKKITFELLQAEKALANQSEGEWEMSFRPKKDHGKAQECELELGVTSSLWGSVNSGDQSTKSLTRHADKFRLGIHGRREWTNDFNQGSNMMGNLFRVDN